MKLNVLDQQSLSFELLIYYSIAFYCEESGNNPNDLAVMQAARLKYESDPEFKLMVHNECNKVINIIKRNCVELKLSEYRAIKGPAIIVDNTKINDDGG